MKVRYVILGAAVASMMSGCFASEPVEEPCNTNVFSFAGSEESLGSSTRLNDALREAERSPNPVRLGDVTRAAGWTDGWDRMIEVHSTTNVDKLNSAAHTQRGQVCWKNLPERGTADGAVPEGYYLFLADTKPVQSVVWYGDRMPLSVGHLSELTPETVLVPDPNDVGVVPAP